MNWNTVTSSKSQGGLGLKDMDDFNTTLLGKAAWHLANNSPKLWVQALSHKYLKGTSIFNAPMRSNTSPIWQGIMKTRNKLQDGFGLRLGDGSSILHCFGIVIGLVEERLQS